MNPNSPSVKSANKIESPELTDTFAITNVQSNKFPLSLTGKIALAYFAILRVSSSSVTA